MQVEEPNEAEQALGALVDAAGGAGDAARVLALMREHTASSYVQLCGLFNLARLVQGPPNVSRAAERGGAADAALAALRAFPAHPGVAGNACCALGNLIVCQPASRERLVAAGVITDIVAVLRDHMADAANAVPTALHALAMLARTPQHARSVADLGAGALALAAMEAHAEDANVQCKACTLVGNLVGQQVAPPGLVLAALPHALRALALSVARVRATEYEEEVDEAGRVATDALYCLETMLLRDDDEERVCAALAAAGGIEAALEALRANEDSEQAQLHGVRLLLLACVNSRERQRRARDDGAADVAAAAAEEFEGTNVARFAEQLLFLMTRADEADVVTPAVVAARGATDA
jgi:hypothetical protein